MSEPKLHHTLPQFYMKRFAKDGKVDVIDRENLDKFFTAPPRKVLAEKHFYSVATDKGRDTSLEKMFATHVEGPAADAFKRVFDDGYSMESPGRRAAISLFLACQYVRGPGTRHALFELHEVMAKAVVAFATPEAARRAAAERGMAITDENLADLVKLEQLGDPGVMFERSATQHLETLVKQAQVLAPYIAGRNWVILDFGAPLLLTSDEPVALVGPKVSAPGDAHGLRDSAQLVFPIDPQRALMMNRSDMPPLPSRMTAAGDAAVIVNRHVAFNAFRRIIRQPGTDPLAGQTLPRKAPAAFAVGNAINFQPNTSEKARAKLLLAKSVRGAGRPHSSDLT